MTNEEREALIASLTDMIQRLRALVKDAFEEGFKGVWEPNCGDGCMESELDDFWKRSDTRAALQPKEG